MGRRRAWQSMDVPSGWVQILRGPRSPSCQWPKVDVQAQASATCISGNSIREPMRNSGEFKLSAVESSIQRSSHQQVSRRGQEVCIFQGGPSSGSHYQFVTKTIRRDHLCSRFSNVPTSRTDCIADSTQFIERANASGPDCPSGREESCGGIRACKKESSPVQSNDWPSSTKKLQGPKLFLPQFHQHIERWWRPPSQ